MTKDYRITVKVRNNRIIRAIESVGGSPGKKWCEQNGLSYTKINDLISLKSSPLTNGGDIHPESKKLSEVVGMLPQDLWSSEQLYPLEKNFSDFEMDYSEVVAMLPAEQQSYLPDFSGMENEQTRKLLSSALSTLSKREQEVIRLRFEEELTLKEAGEALGISAPRVGQIEEKALRKMRHPARIGMFVDCADANIVSDKDRERFKDAAKKYLETP